MYHILSSCHYFFLCMCSSHFVYVACLFFPFVYCFPIDTVYFLIFIMPQLRIQIHIFFVFRNDKFLYLKYLSAKPWPMRVPFNHCVGMSHVYKFYFRLLCSNFSIQMKWNNRASLFMLLKWLIYHKKFPYFILQI